MDTRDTLNHYKRPFIRITATYAVVSTETKVRFYAHKIIQPGSELALSEQSESNVWRRRESCAQYEIQFHALSITNAATNEREWRRRESNPRPKNLKQNVYKLIEFLKFSSDIANSKAIKSKIYLAWAAAFKLLKLTQHLGLVYTLSIQPRIESEDIT